MDREDAKALQVIDMALQPGVRIDRIGYVEIQKSLERIAQRLSELSEQNVEKPSDETE